MQSLSFLGIFAAPILATKLLLPLYEYPLDGSWDSIYDTIEANPDLDFQVIINVDSGPGSSSPNSDFASGTAKLNSYSNVETLGYVHTLFGDASQDEVNQNVSDWYSWNSYTESNVSINGIFFDEVHNTEGTDSDVTYMQSLVESAISTFGSHQLTKIFNPGSKPEHLEFYDLADYVVVFETYASEYSDSVLSENVPSGYANQSAILIPDFASVGTAATAESWLQSMVAAGIASAHILNYDYLQSTSTNSPAAIGSIASALAGAQGDSSSASSSSTASTASATSSKLTTTSTATSASDGESTQDVPVTTTSADTTEETSAATTQATTFATEYSTATEASSTATQASSTATPFSGHHGHSHHHLERCKQHKR